MGKGLKWTLFIQPKDSATLNRQKDSMKLAKEGDVFASRNGASVLTSNGSWIAADRPVCPCGLRMWAAGGTIGTTHEDFGHIESWQCDCGYGVEKQTPEIIE